jgi:hypothetical protein
LMSKPRCYCLRFQIAADELAGIELQYVKHVIKEQTYVDVTALERCNLRMYVFHCDHIKQ